jgi:3-oxoadipate enol-lactonase
MPFAAKETEINGNKVSYFDEGHGDIPVVFLHGFPFSKNMWEPQLEVLKESYRVIAYDVRGHGSSDAGTAEFTISQFAHDFILFLDALRIPQAVVCGLSMGGYIALHAIEKAPERFAALVLADTQCFADTDAAREKRKKAIDSIREKGMTPYAEESVKNLFAPASLIDKPEAVNRIRHTIAQASDDNVTKTLMALAARKDTCNVLPAITCPVLILVGSEDKVTPIEAARKMHELVPGSHLQTIEGAGHVSNLENPETFNTALEAFLHSLLYRVV